MRQLDSSFRIIIYKYFFDSVCTICYFLQDQSVADHEHEKGFISSLLSGKVPVLEDAFPLHVTSERKGLSAQLKWSLLPWKRLNVDSIRNYFGE